MKRAEMIDQLRGGDFEVLVIGGGATQGFNHPNGASSPLQETDSA